MEELRSRSDNFNSKPSSKFVRDLFMVGPPPINEDAIVHLPHNDDTGSSQESDFESKSLLKVQSEASAKTRKKMSFIIDRKRLFSSGDDAIPTEGKMYDVVDAAAGDMLGAMNAS